LEVTIDPHSGFCFGVVNAIQVAETELTKNNHLYCLGDIVHNTEEVSRLKKKGLEIIDHQLFEKLYNCKVLIRAHGEPPETYRIALQNNIELIDASCPVVLKLQTRIRKGYEEMKFVNGQIVIYGKEGHAEVRGLAGQTQNKAIIINNINDLDKIDYSKPIRLFSQTTQSTKGFNELIAGISHRVNNTDYSQHGTFLAFDTICRQVANRAPHLKKFSANHDVIIFVSDKKSSNGLFLFEICNAENPNTYLVSSQNEIIHSWFQNANSIGICGATSTPMWLMEQVANYINNIIIDSIK